MTDDISSSVSCGGCGNPLLKERDMPTGRVPCPICGVTRRNYSECIREEIRVETQVRQSTAGKRGAFTASGRRQHEFKSGDSLTRCTGRWVRLEQHIDRTDPDPANWRYRKKIVDQDTRTARATIKGFEVMRMFKKGQFRSW